ncbi:MAG: hypothetical protein M1829_006685 [Trizodia sp. TS-e1964]|nr:MAG: hypothetical protein M1829_006685 [Trizodia sp. TS-e1964]
MTYPSPKTAAPLNACPLVVTLYNNWRAIARAPPTTAPPESILSCTAAPVKVAEALDALELDDADGVVVTTAVLVLGEPPRMGVRAAGETEELEEAPPERVEPKTVVETEVDTEVDTEEVRETVVLTEVLVETETDPDPDDEATERVLVLVELRATLDTLDTVPPFPATHWAAVEPYIDVRK